MKLTKILYSISIIIVSTSAIAPLPVSPYIRVFTILVSLFSLFRCKTFNFSGPGVLDKSEYAE
uniref:Uncharacterized protein n=1 Tax=Glossina palpalis gambiensis TaxID=67801 RepID=A0A1B0C5P4_9MUSC